MPGSSSLLTRSTRSARLSQRSKEKPSCRKIPIHRNHLLGQHGQSQSSAVGTDIPSPHRQAPSPSDMASNTSTPSHTGELSAMCESISAFAGELLSFILRVG